MTKSLRGVSPLHSIIIGIERGVVIVLLVIVTHKTNEQQTIHGIITMQRTIGALMFHLKY